MMNLEVSSFFNRGVWRPVDFETFKRSVNPADDEELNDMLLAMENGQAVLSVFGTLKFRAAPEQEEGAGQLCKPT